MPPVSEVQRRAMWAAKEGRSTIGIPRSVGQEFIGDDKTPNGHAAGILFVAPDGEVLLLKRSGAETNYAGHWALPGGKGEAGETPDVTAHREAAEELGGHVGGTLGGGVSPMKIIDRRATPNGMAFHTYARPVSDKFAPRLNEEHSGYAWFGLDDLPPKVHPSVMATLQERIGVDAGMTPEDWSGLREGLVKWLGQEEDEEEHAEDCGGAYDRRPPWHKTGDVMRSGMAFDRGTVRRVDANGHLHVAITNISKAAINPYLGREIPDWEKLGLQPDRIYKLYRDPEELAKAAPTFNNLPLLSEHIPVTSEDHPHDVTIGSTGTDAVFHLPYLCNSLVVWTKGGIDAIESEAQKELSSAYRYRADMTPGTFEGEQYDGVMRDIVGNHVALVKEGRAGSDVVVGDSNQEIRMSAKPVILTRKAAMTLGALIGYAKPKIAADAKLNASTMATPLADLTAKNFKERKPAIATGFRAMMKPHLAKDASLDDVEKVLDMLEAHEPAERGTADAMETDPNTGLPIAPIDANDNDVPAFLKGKLSQDDFAAYEKMAGAKKPAQDAEETDEEKEARLKKEAAEKAANDDAPEKKPPGITKAAMDAAIKDAVDKATRDAATAATATREAEKKIRPYVGELAIAQDSAEGVFRTALTMLGVRGAKELPAAALEAVLEAQPLPGSTQKPRVALDGAMKEFKDHYPSASRIQVL